MFCKLLFAASLALLASLCHPAAGQQIQKELSGTVTTQPGSTPLAYASVSVLSPPDSSLVAGTYTDDRGKFELRVSAPDTVWIKVSYLGYQNQVLSAFFPRGDSAITLGSIVLKPLPNALKTVTVTAEKEKMYTFKRDTVEFNVPEDFMTGGTAQDVLEYTPTLTMDGDNQLMVKGKANVKVYVDNRPIELTGMDVQTYLQNTPSFMIEKIQILKTPPDPQDAAEALAAGVTDQYYVNILTRKIRFRGYNTALTAGLNSRKELSGRFRFNMNLDPFRVNYFNNLRYNTDSSYIHRTSFLDSGDSSLLDQRNYGTHFRFDQYINGSYTFQFAEKETLRLEARGGLNEGRETSTHVSSIHNPKGTGDQDRIQDSRSHAQGYRLNTSADYRKKYAREGRELRARLDLSLSNQHNESRSLERYQLSGDSLHQHNDGNNGNLNLRANVRYRNPFGNDKFYMVNGGLSLSGRHNLNDVSRSDFTSPVLHKSDTLSTNYYSSSSSYNFLFTVGKQNQHLGWIAATRLAYHTQRGSDHYRRSRFNNQSFTSHNAIGFNYGRGKDAQLTVRLNPGLESYLQETHTNDSVPGLTYRYLNFIPGASARYATGHHEISLNYNRDIDRPQWNQLNPYIDNRDPLNVSHGNPDLRPEFTNRYHLRYEYNQDVVYVAFDMENDQSKDVISSYRSVDSSGISTRTYVNLNDRTRDNMGLDVGTHYFRNIPAINGNLNINAEAGMDAYRMRSDDEHVSADFQDVSGLSSHLKMWSSIRWGIFSLIVNGRYQGPRYLTQGKQPSRFSSGLRSRADLLNHRLNFTLGIENLFGASVKDAYYKTDTYEQYSSNRQQVRYFSLYITYKFRKFDKLDTPGDNNG